MPWSRNEPDPLEAMKRKLAEQERALSEQRSRLMAELHGPDGSDPDHKKLTEPPVWRLEEDSGSHRETNPTPARKRNLARQRQRDMILVIALCALLMVVLIIVVWIAYVHTTTQASGN